ncbi:site-specific integrase [Streptomyces aurantiacus]|uniref:Tyr recombinase domain-containing protein n=1 Tax=Streptomyces aurantiacus TaxID=47760 RepID=A0A7G1P0T4_9ACTN|nr:site-specific integrase [Streptomyces aurantiacus]BCL27386.1 hypothetical protein GCM10017557_22450 [Streptomyces aurantiacus]
MNQPDDNELFNRLEAEMTADSGGEVVDLDKARSARTESADPTARPDADPSADSAPDRSAAESGAPTARVMVDQPTAKAAGPGYLGRLLAARRRPVVPVWLKSLAELKTATAWVARHYAHSVGYHALRSPVYAARLTFQAPSGAAKLPSQVHAVRKALPERYRSMVDVGAGCGLRQGEIIGLAEDALDFEGEILRVVRQVKLIRGKAVFAPPKCNKERDVPLPPSVAETIRAHVDAYKPVEVTLPWRKPDGPKVSARLLFTNTANWVVWRSNFNIQEWKPSIAAAGLITEAGEDGKYQSAREHGMHALRHFYASVLLDAGESIKAVSQYLGHSDPGLTLRVYAHLMPSSQERTRRAVDTVLSKHSVT